MSKSEFKDALDRTSEIQLTVRGRKSSQDISRPVWFVHENNTLYLLPIQGSDTNWYKNMLKDPTIKISIDRQGITRKVKPITDSSKVKTGAFNDGVGIILGRLWRGKNAELYSIRVDLDNLIAIKEFGSRNGKTISLSELAQWTIVEIKMTPIKHICTFYPFRLKGDESGIVLLYIWLYIILCY